jgi:hypothetical protein
MSDRYHGDRTERFDPDDRDDSRRDDPPRREAARKGPPLPAFLARRLLRKGEEVASVRGPRSSPVWEPYLTHPAAVAVGFAAAVVIFLVGGLAVDWDGQLMAAPGIAAVVVAGGGLALVAVAAGYFTRLVVTSQRVLIVQGYEVRKTWTLDQLPRSLVRHDRNADGELTKTVDMEKLQTMLGGSADGIVEAKSIWALGKEIERTRREDRREARREDDPRTERWGDRHGDRWDDRRRDE